MTDSELICRDERRRHAVRAAGFHGLDFLEVSDDQRTLTVYFLGKAPEGLSQEHVRIEGGVRVRDIRVVDVTIRRQDDPDLDDWMDVTVDRPGDFSPYVLRLVELDARGRPTGRPFPDFDPRYAYLKFTFKAGCPSDLDCKTEEVCPPPDRFEPEIDYLAKDYASFRKLILDRLSLIIPDWQERHVPDLGIALVEVLAYVGDYLSYYQDAAANEAYLETARQRISVRRHARLVDYPMHEGCNARAWVWVELAGGNVEEFTLDDPGNVFFITEHAVGSPRGKVLTADDLRPIPRGEYEVFEPMADSPIRFYAAHNRILFYTWGDAECCLPRGATTATLRDEWIAAEEPRDGETEQKPPKEPPVQRPPERERALRLQPGDVLIFEEVIGPKTGGEADADPLRRHAVRLTRVDPGVDPVHDQPVVEIAWAEEDALPFPLCLSTIGPPPECKLLLDVSVVRGNVVLVDHGRRIVERPEPSTVPAREPVAHCEGEGRPGEVTTDEGNFRPTLTHGPLTFREPLSPGLPASRAHHQDPRKAVPQIEVAGGIDKPEGPEDTEWSPRPDLLGSHGDDRHFVVEIDNEGRVHLRFGDGDLGRVPEAGTAFAASYRVGNGRSGNVGAEAISHITLRHGRLDGISLKPRNPLPAAGGTDPEPLAEVRLFAPHAFRVRQLRAITAEDYARLAILSQSGVTGDRPAGRAALQRAAAALRWTGSWYEVLVAVDPAGKSTADEPLLNEIAGSLYPLRRIGHDLKVAGAHYVSLDLAMSVCVLPDYLRGHVKAALLDLFSNRRLPDGRRGLFYPDNLTFGEGVEVSRLVAVAQAVPGVESVVVTKLERLYEGPNREVEKGVLPLGPLEVARLDNDPNFPENGILRLEMRGGR